MAGFGGLGGFGSGLGGPEFPDILTALGTALLSSPRDAPFANLPQTLQAATQAGQKRQSDAALAMALKQAGVENPEMLVLNPTAATLAINQANLSKRAAIGAGLTDAVKGLYGSGSSAPASSDTAAPSGGLSGLGGPRVPTFAAISGDRPAGNIANIITNAAARHGVDPDTLVRTAQIESGLNPNAANPNSSASGLFQFINSTAREYGLSNPRDPAASADAGARLMKDNTEQLYSVLGRKPEPWELYLAHQQGIAGATRLLSHPSARAVDLVGADAVRLNGGNANMTAAQFAGLWRQKFGSTYNQADGGRALGDVARSNQAAAAPPAPSSEFQATSATERDRALGVPGTQVAAAGATKLPTPIQVPPNLQKPLAESGFKPGTATLTALARQKQQVALQLILGSAAMGDDGKQFSEFGKLLWQDAGKYLDPTDTTRALVQAGIDPNSEQGRQIQRFALEEPQLKFAQGERQYARSVQEHEERMGLERQRFAESQRTEEEKKARASQGMYGPAIDLQRREEDARKAAETQATTEATARGKFAEAATSSAQAAESLQGAITRAKGHFENVVKLGGYGPWAAGVVGRAADQFMGSLGPGGAPQQKAEIERQHFDSAMATVRNAVTVARARASGDRQVSNVDRVLLAADLPGLTASDPSVAREAFRQLQSDIDRAAALDKKYGLYRGEQQQPAAGAAALGPGRYTWTPNGLVPQ